MKKVILIRHGSAEEKSGGITDFERSLTTTGKAITRIMAGKLKKLEKDPGLLITSPAFRAIETALIFAREFNINPGKIIIENILYDKADPEMLQGILESVDEKISTVTLFGHNPSFTEMACRLSSTGFEFMTKTSIVCLEFREDTWTGIRPRTGNIEYFLQPE